MERVYWKIKNDASKVPGYDGPVLDYDLLEQMGIFLCAKTMSEDHFISKNKYGDFLFNIGERVGRYRVDMYYTNGLGNSVNIGVLYVPYDSTEIISSIRDIKLNKLGI